jgi:hypothetical protein
MSPLAASLITMAVAAIIRIIEKKILKDKRQQTDKDEKD